MDALSTNLRKVGGSVMLAVPPLYLEALHLMPGSKVDLTLTDGRIQINPKPRPRYTVDELLAASDYSAPLSEAERDWVSGPSVGRELL